MLDATYREKIIEEILREKLQDGIVPTADELIEEFELRTASHPDFAIPIIRDKDHEVALRSKSDSKKFNDFFTRAQSDMKVLYTEIWDRVLDSGESFDRWRIEVERLKKELLELETQIDGLLFLRQDTEGYFTFIEETFTDLEDVDQENTTANVDIVNHQVTIDNKAATDGRVKVFGLQKNKNEMASIDMSKLRSGDVTFTILTRDDIASSTLAAVANLKNAFTDSTKFWQHQVRTSRGDKPISAELKVRFGSAIQISGITMSLHSANNSSPVTVIAQYSTDGYNWFNLPTENYTQSIDNYGAFHFKKTYMKWVKFIMTKFGPDAVDNGQYVYEFGANMIRFLRTTFPMSTSSVAAGIYQSEYMSSYDDDDNRRTFDKVSLRTCQETPGPLGHLGQAVSDTSITYEVKASNGTDETDWLKIDPADTVDPAAPLIVKFGKTTGPGWVIPTDWGDDDLGTLQTLLVIEWMQTLLDLDMTPTQLLSKESVASQAYFQQYSDVLGTDKLALYGDIVSWQTHPTEPYSISPDDFANIRNFNLHRNGGARGGSWDPEDEEMDDSEFTRGAPNGWYRQEDVQGYVMTTVLLLTDTVIDFGGTTAYLDNKQVSGKTTFTKGYHLFKTHDRNFQAVPWGDPNTLDVWASEEALSDYDSLYPYNHRKLIEGVHHKKDSFDGQKIYNGVDMHFERFCQRVSVFDLIYNTADDDYSKYAIDMYDGNHVFVTKYDTDDDLSGGGNEGAMLQYNIAQDPYDRVKLKASLHTQNPLRTPVLSAWRIKLG